MKWFFITKTMQDRTFYLREPTPFWYKWSLDGGTPYATKNGAKLAAWRLLRKTKRPYEIRQIDV